MASEVGLRGKAQLFYNWRSSIALQLEKLMLRMGAWRVDVIGYLIVRACGLEEIG